MCGPIVFSLREEAAATAADPQHQQAFSFPQQKLWPVKKVKKKRRKKIICVTGNIKNDNITATVFLFIVSEICLIFVSPAMTR